MTERPAAGSRREFSVALTAAVVLSGVFALILASPLSVGTREAFSGVGFITGALLIMVSVGLAARRCPGRRRRGWQLLAWAAALVVSGNAWTTLSGGDPVEDTSIVGDSLIAVALVATVFGLLELSDTPFRGARLLVNTLDGVVTGCAVLIIATVLVFSRLVESENLAERPHVLIFPILDVMVATVALLLIIRNQGNRSFYLLVGFGFVLWAVGDLTFAVQHAQGDYAAGTPQDLMWIAGYLLLAAGAWHPAATRRASETPTDGAFDVQGTVLVFALLLVAAAVQSLFPGGPLTKTLTLLWVFLVLAVGARQTLLVADNQRLRAGLEQRVREQTADIRRMSRRLEVMLNSVGEGIYGVDLAGRITFVNPAAASTLGYEPDQLLGHSAHEMLHGLVPSEPGHEADSCYVAEPTRDGQAFSGLVDTYLRRDGTAFPVEATVGSLIDDDSVSGAVVVFRDVTQRREIDRMKDEFLSIVSHELRTPLTSIRGSLGMLGSGAFVQLTPQAEQMVSIAVQSSDRLTRLINDILDVERIQSGKLPMEFTTRDSGELVRNAAQEMSGLAAAAGVQIDVGHTEGLVSADADRILQTLTNLVGNAVKFSPAGGSVTVATRAEGDQVVFIVADEGRGIPSDKLQSIFDPFEQVDSSDSREKGGTGIGLTISRGIVERHGGRIWAESEPGHGTVLRFTLPRVTQPVAAPR